MDDLAFYDDKPCSDCEHLGADHNVDGECFLCECEAYHWHEGCLTSGAAWLRAEEQGMHNARDKK